MRTPLLIIITVATLGCATAPMSSLPEPNGKASPKPKAEPRTIRINDIHVPLVPEWNPLPGRDTDDLRVWMQEGRGAVLTMHRYAYKQMDPDTMLENTLGELRARQANVDGMKWYPGATAIRWTEGTTRGFACARGFPKSDGPLTIVFIGVWSPEDDEAMAADALRGCLEASER